MVLPRDRFADVVAGPVAEATAGTAVINYLSAASRDEVDDLVVRALRSGGKPWPDKMQQGPMCGRSFADPDGNVWEVPVHGPGRRLTAPGRRNRPDGCAVFDHLFE